jgi:ribosomal protein S18 acetylase RimI-like enzyme
MGRIKNFLSRTITSLTGRNPKFIQMRLFVKNITPEFEEALKQKIEHNIVQAEIREANEKDVDCLIKLHDRAWHSTPMPYRPLKKDSIEKMLKDSKIIFLIAKVRGEESGFALIYFTGEEDLIGVIAGLGIIPELHRKGLGTILGLAVWDYFKKKGVIELRCKVYEDNKTSYNFIKGLKFEEYDEDFVQWKVF